MVVCYSLRGEHHDLFNCSPKVDSFPDSINNVLVNNLLFFKSLISDHFLGLDSYKWSYLVKGKNCVLKS